MKVASGRVAAGLHPPRACPAARSSRAGLGSAAWPSSPAPRAGVVGPERHPPRWCRGWCHRRPWGRAERWPAPEWRTAKAQASSPSARAIVAARVRARSDTTHSRRSPTGSTDRTVHRRRRSPSALRPNRLTSPRVKEAYARPGRESTSSSADDVEAALRIPEALLAPKPERDTVDAGRLQHCTEVA